MASLYEVTDPKTGKLFHVISQSDIKPEEADNKIGEAFDLYQLGKPQIPLTQGGLLLTPVESDKNYEKMRGPTQGATEAIGSTLRRGYENSVGLIANPLANAARSVGRAAGPGLVSNLYTMNGPSQAYTQAQMTGQLPGSNVPGSLGQAERVAGTAMGEVLASPVATPESVLLTALSLGSMGFLGGIAQTATQGLFNTLPRLGATVAGTGIVGAAFDPAKLTGSENLASFGKETAVNVATTLGLAKAFSGLGTKLAKLNNQELLQEFQPIADKFKMSVPQLLESKTDLKATIDIFEQLNSKYIQKSTESSFNGMIQFAEKHLPDEAVGSIKQRLTSLAKNVVEFDSLPSTAEKATRANLQFKILNDAQEISQAITTNAPNPGKLVNPQNLSYPQIIVNSPELRTEAVERLKRFPQYRNIDQNVSDGYLEAILQNSMDTLSSNTGRSTLTFNRTARDVNEVGRSFILGETEAFRTHHRGTTARVWQALGIDDRSILGAQFQMANEYGQQFNTTLEAMTGMQKINLAQFSSALKTALNDATESASQIQILKRVAEGRDLVSAAVEVAGIRKSNSQTWQGTLDQVNKQALIKLEEQALRSTTTSTGPGFFGKTFNNIKNNVVPPFLGGRDTIFPDITGSSRASVPTVKAQYGNNAVSPIAVQTLRELLKPNKEQ